MTGIMIQAAVLVIAVLFIQTALGGRLHAYVRYGLWLIVALRLLVPVNVIDSPLSALRLTESIARFEEDEDASGSRYGHYADTAEGDPYGQAYVGVVQTIWGAGEDETQAVGPQQDEKSAALPVLWISGSLLVGIVLGLSRFRFYRKLRRERIICEKAVLPVYRVKGLESPCLAGLLHPTVYIGDNIAEDSDYFRYAVTHEEVHYLHGDHIWAFVRAVLVTVYWFHPLVWVAAVCSVKDAELACDHGTVQRLGVGERFAYGEMLLELSRVQKGKKAYSFGMMLKPGKTELKGRIQRLMKTRTNKAWASALAILLIVSMAGCTFTGVSQETAAGEAVLPEETETALEEKAEEAEALAGEIRAAEEKVKALAEEKTALAAEREALAKEKEALKEEKEALAAATDDWVKVNQDGVEGYVSSGYVSSLLTESDNAESVTAYEDVAIFYMEPCEYTRISDTFGERTNPVTQEVIKHEGIDYAAPEGTDITAAADGTVYETGFSADYGNYVILLHTNGEKTYYGCCNEILVEKDMQVKRGSKIATVGSTGRSTGAHLYFALQNRDGEFVDPQAYMQ